MGDSLVAWSLLALGAVVTVTGLAIPSVRHRWSAAIGLAQWPQPARCRAAGVRTGEDPDLIATALVGRACVDGRAEWRDVVISVRWDRSAVLAVAGVTTGPHTLRVARDLIAEHLRAE